MIGAAPAPGLRRVEDVMGMPIYLDVRDPEPGVEAIERMFDWLRWVDATFSTYKPDSDISRIAGGALRVEDAHPEVRAVLTRCEELRGETDGYFDAWAGGALDPSGLVKGWSVERAAAILSRSGHRDFAVNAGGDIRLHGRAQPDETWRAGIQHPLERDRIAAVVEATNLAIATSGAYARGDHVLDPNTGRAPAGILSATVTGPDLGTADAYATAAFAMGPAARGWIGTLRSYEAMLILASGEVLTTVGFPSV